ncbi:MAG: NHL repeat-containing protein, partial [Candidatus Binataceae bacterium]
ITIYAAGAHGNASPSSTISGSKTGLAFPEGIALDSGGNIYVANEQGGPSSFGSVTVYRAGSNANAVPTVTISGSSTYLALPEGIALDSAGNIYVTNYEGNSGLGSITIFAAGASGDVFPTTAIEGGNTGLSGLERIAVDSSGNIYVANSAASNVTVYSAGSANNVAPSATISSTGTGLSMPNGIALDSGGNIYVANVTGGASTNGSVTSYLYAGTGYALPLTDLTGAATGLGAPQGVAIDSTGNVYVANNSLNSVTIYPPGADANASPSATISGAATGLSQPYGIALDSSGNIYVANHIGGPAGNGSVTVYATGATANASPTVTISAPASGTDNTGLDLPDGIALDSSGNIYVVNNAGGPSNLGSVTIYPAGSSGNAAPNASIAGNLTGLDEAGGIAVDSSGNIYISNEANDSVTVYARGANGNAAPAITIAGPQTALFSPLGLTLSP